MNLKEEGGSLLKKGFPFPLPNLPLSPPKTFINGAGGVWGGPAVSLGGSFPEPLFSCYVVEGPLQRIMAFPPGKIFATNIFSVARREIY